MAWLCQMLVVESIRIAGMLKPETAGNPGTNLLQSSQTSGRAFPCGNTSIALARNYRQASIYLRTYHSKTVNRVGHLYETGEAAWNLSDLLYLVPTHIFLILPASYYRQRKQICNKRIFIVRIREFRS